MTSEIKNFSNRAVLYSLFYILATLFLHFLIAQFDIGKTPFYTWGNIFYLFIVAYVFSFLFFTAAFFVRYKYIWAKKILYIIGKYFLFSWPIGNFLGKYLLDNLKKIEDTNL
jgi:hypothetical protein